MHYIRTFLYFILLCFIKPAFSLELDVGIEFSNKSVWVEEIARGPNEIAMIDSEDEIMPSITLRTSTGYFSEGSNWGYHFQLDGSIFNVSMQTVPGSDELQDFGTSIDGYSLFAVPVAYYHFNNTSKDEWSYKAGIGAGIGYLHLEGTYQITHDGHPEIGTVKSVDASGFGLAVGVYLEASKGKHIIVVQNYAPTVDDGRYEYMQHNVLIAYRYAVDLSEFFD